MQLGHESRSSPCVVELCLGDSLKDLAAISWDRHSVQTRDGNWIHTVDFRVTPSQLEVLSQEFRGNVGAAAPYLQQRSFDEDAITALSNVTGACVTHRLYGRYITKDGNPTTVGIALISTRSSAPQKWTVVEITREVVNAESIDQMDAMKRELHLRYEKWENEFASPAQMDESHSVFVAYTVTHLIFTLALQLAEPEWASSSVACRDNRRASID
jgi:hypothetical protein